MTTLALNEPTGLSPEEIQLLLAASRGVAEQTREIEQRVSSSLTWVLVVTAAAVWLYDLGVVLWSLHA
ncbi:MAG: hypothetical protein QOF18_994 [Frankiaceae bacterium]|nr:hypothetical protein [Frankiaceae bacterium]